MVFGKGRENITSFILDRKTEEESGEFYSYSSGDSNLLMSILDKIYAQQDPLFPFTKLLKPLKISSATWQRDNKGVYLGSSFFYATLRDYAKLGQLFLQKGIWNNKKIFEPQWLNDSLNSFGLQFKNQPKSLEHPAAHLWLNRTKNTLKNSEKKWLNVPDDAFYASGHWGQIILIIPSLKMTITRLASDKTKKFNLNKLFLLLKNNLLYLKS